LLVIHLPDSQAKFCVVILSDGHSCHLEVPQP
jgi:hypothetical protein